MVEQKFFKTALQLLDDGSEVIYSDHYEQLKWYKKVRRFLNRVEHVSGDVKHIRIKLK